MPLVQHYPAYSGPVSHYAPYGRMPRKRKPPRPRHRPTSSISIIIIISIIRKLRKVKPASLASGVTTVATHAGNVRRSGSDCPACFAPPPRARSCGPALATQNRVRSAPARRGGTLVHGDATRRSPLRLAGLNARPAALTGSLPVQPVA